MSNISTDQGTAENRRFECGKGNGGVAQLGEHLPCTQGVSGSNPLISTKASEQTTLCSEPPKRFARRGFVAPLRSTPRGKPRGGPGLLLRFPQSLRLCGEMLGKGYVGS